ncbi:MAG: response regulator transcription factor [Burkholderiales bacterium]|nr:MAG: response regulator transcription factor [Burkholderiales bacterium]
MERRILVVEDQKDIAELIAMHLSDLGHRVEAVGDGLKGLELARSGDFDVIVLDVMLPGMDGLEIVKTLRAERRATPVLMLTARSTEIDRVLGLELGADDYLTKPFSIPELQARVKAMLRRVEMSGRQAEAEMPDRLRIGDILIDTVSHSITLRGEPVQLTTKEYDLLLHFARNPGRVFTRVQLLDAIWGTTYEGYEHNVNTHINRLRGKIEDDPANPRYVLTVRGVGYRMVDES